MKNLDGGGKEVSFPGNTTDSCAKTCTDRSGCTAYEFNKAGNQEYACITYTATPSSLRRSDDTPSTWVSCIQSNCGIGFTESVKWYNGHGGGYSRTQRSGMDKQGCANKCSDRKGCTSYRWYTNYCDTFTADPATLMTANRHPHWTACVKDDCDHGYSKVAYDLNGGGKMVYHAGHNTQDCAKKCNERSGCTAYEFNKGGNDDYKCITYTAEPSSLHGDEHQQFTGWASCIKDRVAQGQNYA